MLKRVVAVAAGLTVTIAITLLLLFLAEQVTGPSPSVDVRPALLLVGLVGLNCVTYVVWANRWNIVAHTSLAFSVVAYIVPIAFLNQLDGLSSDALDLYYQVVAAGLLFAVLGVLAGAALAGLYDTGKLKGRAAFEDPGVQAVIRRRVLWLTALSVAGVLVAFAGMGFVPALTADPLTAKFFRGAYAAAYQPVAPIYRGATSVLAILLPLVFLYAIKIRRGKWVLLAASAIVALFLGLMREPAVTGVLLLLGVWVCVRHKSLTLYFAILVVSYLGGGALYYILSLIGLGNFSGSPGAQGGFLEQAAAGAPDIKDQILFLTSWLARPEYTNGLTWLGGLLPGNNPWNPSVWSLHVVNPGQDITSIASGGLRLPAPIWGLVSFGWPGVVAVSLLTGVVQGFLAGVAKRVIPSSSVEISVYWLVIYVALVEVLPAFFRFSYLSVLQLVIILLLFRWRTRPSDDRGFQQARRSTRAAVPLSGRFR